MSICVIHRINIDIDIIVIESVNKNHTHTHKKEERNERAKEKYDVETKCEHKIWHIDGTSNKRTENTHNFF